MPEIVVDERQLGGMRVAVRNHLNSGVYNLDRIIAQHDSTYSKDSSEIKSALIESFSYQKAVAKEIEKASFQNYERGKVFSIEVAGRVGNDLLTSSEECQIFENVMKLRDVNLEALVPDPVNESLKSYFEALKQSVNYGGNIRNTTSAFFRWMKAASQEVEQRDGYEVLHTFLQKNPIVVGKYKFDRCDGFNLKQSVLLSWDGIGGYDKQKQELMDLKLVIDNIDTASSYMKNPIPRGVLFVGPSGTGKTLLATTFAHLSGIPYEFVNAATIGSTFVNKTASSYQKLFDKVAAPIKNGISPASALIVDEYELVCPDRKYLKPGEDTKVGRVFFDNMDGPSYVPGVMVMAMTNRGYMLDPATLSRFTYQIEVDLPDNKQRTEVFRSILEDQEKFAANNCGKMAGDFMEKINYKRLASESEQLSCRNIRDILIDEVQSYNLKQALRTGEPIKMITNDQVSEDIRSYKKKNALKIQKNIADWEMSKKYIQEMSG